MAFTLVRVAVIAIKNNQILLMRRFKEGREFWVIPGGSVEAGETLEEAGRREMKEETNLDMEIGEKLWENENRYWDGEGRQEYYFLAKKISGGEVKLTGEELSRHPAENQFRPEWVALDRIKEINLVPEFVKEKIINKFID